MAHIEGGSDQLTRRGFMGWGAILLTAAALPGATILLGETSASAATLAPYAFASWVSLTQRSVQAARPGRTSANLKVVMVTNLATTQANMIGDVFSVSFQVAKPLPAGIYTITAPSLGQFPLYVSGQGTTVQALINRRLPA